jgi:4-hydroxybenzoate polyprenyltransferase
MFIVCSLLFVNVSPAFELLLSFIGVALLYYISLLIFCLDLKHTPVIKNAASEPGLI